MAPPARADIDMFETRNLSFGRFTLRDFDTPQSILVTPDNQPSTADSGIVTLDPGLCGIYTLTGLPLGTTLNVFMSGGTLTMGGGRPITVDDFVIYDDDFDSDLTDANNDGNMTLYIGATLTTDGLGHYPDGIYEGEASTDVGVPDGMGGTMDIFVNF